MRHRLLVMALAGAALGPGFAALGQTAPGSRPAPPPRPAAPAAAPPATSSPAGAPRPAGGEAAAAPAPTDRNWAMTCGEAAAGEPPDCRISTSILLQPQNQRLAGIVLLRQPETRSLSLVFQLPHGVWLPAGLAWQIDEGESQRLAFQSSDAEGLYAGFPVADDLFAALRRGSTLRLSFMVGPRRDPLTVPVPMARFAEATGEMFAAERARP